MNAAAAFVLSESILIEDWIETFYLTLILSGIERMVGSSDMVPAEWPLAWGSWWPGNDPADLNHLTYSFQLILKTSITIPPV